MERSALEIEYDRVGRRKDLIAIVALCIAIAVAFFSIFLNQVMHLVDFQSTWDVLVAHLHGTSTGDRNAELVVWTYGVPRAIMGIIVGMGLAVGGAVMQSLLRNPLAEPYTTGVASGASFGAALMILLGISIFDVNDYNLSVTLNAIALAMVPTLAIVLISKQKRITPTTTILAGIAVMYVFRSCTTLMTLVSDADEISDLYVWNVGSVGPARWDNVWIVFAVVSVSLVLLQLMSRQICLMTAGDKSASSMGVRVKAVRASSLLVVAVMTATAVGFTGTISFMGLVAPHIARMLVGSNTRHLIPCSAAIGALILIGCDCVAKVLIGFPVGIFTAIVGGPLFIILLIKGAKKIWFRFCMGDMTSILLMAHGSSEDANGNSAEILATRLSEMLGRRVHFAYKGEEEPTIATALYDIAAENPERIIVIPLFFAPGIFTKKFIPRKLNIPEGMREGVISVNGKSIPIVMTAAFGTLPGMRRVMLNTVRNLPASTSVLLVSHGSKDGDAQKTAELNASYLREAGYRVHCCYNQFNHPDVAEGVAESTEGECDTLLIVPMFSSSSHHSVVEIPQKLGLAPGQRDGVVSVNGKEVRITYGKEIGLSPDMADVLLAEINRIDTASS